MLHKIGFFLLLILICINQITLNQQPNKHRQYAVKRIQNNRQQSKDLKKLTNRSSSSNHKFSSRTNPFRDFLKTEPSEIVLEKDVSNNDVINSWNSDNWNSWSPPSWKTKPSGWSGGGDSGWNNGWWWEPDPWKDPYKKLSLVKIKPEIQEVYAADVLIRENRNSNFGINGFVQFVQFVSIKKNVL